jgi:methyl-accepting chemotaxis protein
LQRNQKIGMRILIPAVSVTAIFSIALFFIGNTVLNRLVEQNFNRIVQSKTADIFNNEKRIAENLLAHVA